MTGKHTSAALTTVNIHPWGNASAPRCRPAPENARGVTRRQPAERDRTALGYLRNLRRCASSGALERGASVDRTLTFITSWTWTLRGPHML
jgi:hypothetical protein